MHLGEIEVIMVPIHGLMAVYAQSGVRATIEEESEALRIFAGSGKPIAPRGDALNGALKEFWRNRPPKPVNQDELQIFLRGNSPSH
mgnify:CR=1 FL=1